MEINNKTMLSGISIIDLADEKASFCTKLLADFGARIIKIEKPGGDESRKTGPFLDDDPEKSLSFFYNNTNKLGITLDIEKKEGKKIFLKLIQNMDGVIETFSPGFLEKIGLGYETLSKTNPGLIMTSVSGFGQTGPKKDETSCDLVASATGGQMNISGTLDAFPLKPYGEQSCFSASLFSAISILLAIRNRNKTGKGEHIDISLQETVASTLEHVMVRYFYENVITQRQGAANWNNAFCILPCRDGFIQVSIFQQWETLVEWMESEGMAEDLTEKKWLDEDYRNKNRDHILEVMKKWTENHTTDELFEMGQLMRFPWAPVHSPTQVVDSPHLKERSFFKNVDYPETGKIVRYPGLPMKSTVMLSDPDKPAPAAGEHNNIIYQQELGMTDKELSRLYTEKII